ncbi:hypothetical protein ACRQ5Q_07805 [Bradyrhizobium sp. PMVTL-01]|uniref:hypothetical protein n=1 Tax=Bradyrhizobium sp. PMVTL-01 TaxID=3434999 RepID=UPI003F71DA50
MAQEFSDILQASQDFKPLGGRADRAILFVEPNRRKLRDSDESFRIAVSPRKKANNPIQPRRTSQAAKMASCQLGRIAYKVMRLWS